MSDYKKYYYMRLKDNYFNTDIQILLESMQDGYLYSNLLLKLYLKCLKNNGKLMFNEFIPYNVQMLATISNHQVGTVEKALKIFKELGLIEILDSGVIYMLDIQNFIGESSTEADRKRRYRNIIESERIGQMSDKYPPEIEIEKEIDIKKEIKIKKKDKIDKIDKNNENQINSPFIEYLIKENFTKVNDLELPRYEELFYSLLSTHSQKNITIALKYIVNHIKNSDIEIKDKYNYLKESITTWLNKKHKSRNIYE